MWIGRSFPFRRLAFVMALFIPAVLAQAQTAPNGPPKTKAEGAPLSALFASLQLMKCGPGVVVCAPSGTDPKLTDLGAGISLWLQYSLSASPKFGKMPTFSLIHTKREEMHKSHMRLALSDAIELAKHLGLTHAAIGEITGSADKAQVSYRVYSV